MLVSKMPLYKRRGGRKAVMYMYFRCVIVLFVANFQRVGKLRLKAEADGLSII